MKKNILLALLLLVTCNVALFAADEGENRSFDSSPISNKRSPSPFSWQGVRSIFGKKPKIAQQDDLGSASVPPSSIVFADFEQDIVGVPEVPAVGGFTPIKESASSSLAQSPDSTQESVASSLAQSPNPFVIHRRRAASFLAQKRNISRSSSAPSNFLLDRSLTPAKLRDPKGMARRPDIKWMSELESAISDRDSRISKKRELEQAQRERLRQQSIDRTYDNEIYEL